MATINSNPQSTSSDPWDQFSTTSGQAPNAAANTAKSRRATIPDDWDQDDEDDEEVENEGKNQRIWEDANTKSPMPEVIMQSSSAAAAPPPAAAFQPQMRILKRPSPSTMSSTSSSGSSRQNESLAEREAKYQAARERIFGQESGSTTTKASSSTTSLRKEKSGSRHGTPTPTSCPGTPAVAVYRNPLGPTSSPGETDNDTLPRGFESRRNRNPKSAQVLMSAD